jgi:hypothetical protein
MARNRFVIPDVVRLSLSDGDWIDVKKELNAGEQRKVFTNLVKNMQAGEKPELNPDQVGKTKLMAYIVDWSLVDAKGERVKFTEGALDGVDSDTYGEIVKAVDAHDEAAEHAREARKNVQGTPTISPATLPSASTSPAGL